MKNSERLKKLEEKDEKYSSRKKGSGRRETKKYKGDSDCDRTDKRGSNSPEWYAANAQLLRDAASIPFPYAVGSPITDSVYNQMHEGKRYSVPGICALRLYPTVGVCDRENTPINIAARNLYTYVRHVNSGHANYDSPDLFMYCIAMASVCSFHAWLRRIYGTLSTYSPVNRYFPKAIIEAQGLDFDDLMANMAQFRFEINNMAVRFGSLCVPSTMSYFARQVWLYDNLYVDSPSMKAQTYLFTPAQFYKLNVYDAEGTSRTKLEYLTTKISHNSKLKLQDLRAMINELLNPLVSNEDINIMSGDILKAFGEKNVYHIPDTPENYSVIPVYNPEVLAQMQNATALGDIKADIDQNTAVGGGYILSVPTVVRNGSRAPMTSLHSADKMLSFLVDNVEPGLAMVATRLTAFAKDATEGQVTDVTTCGTEIVGAFEFTTYDEVTNSSWNPKTVSLRGDQMEITSMADPGTMANAIRNFGEQVDLLSKFDQHPEVFIVHTDANPSSPAVGSSKVVGRVWDVCNYTIVKYETIEKMNEVALLSMFDTLQLGR